MTSNQNSPLHYTFGLRNRWVQNIFTVIFIQFTRDFGDFYSGMSTMRARSCNILHSCRVCFASTSGRLGVGISRCKHYLVLGFGRLWKLVGHEVRSRCFCVVNFASVCLLRWRNFRKTRYGMVRPWYTSVALVAVCDLTYSACGDDTCQLNLWNVKHFKCYARVNCER